MRSGAPAFAALWYVDEVILFVDIEAYPVGGDSSGAQALV